MSERDLSRVLQAFVGSAIEHSEATEVGDYRRANRAYSRIEELGRDLASSKEAGRAGLAALSSDDQHPAVRMWAAVFLHPMDRERARAVLERVAAEEGFLGFTARVTLDELEVDQD